MGFISTFGKRVTASFVKHLLAKGLAVWLTIITLVLNLLTEEMLPLSGNDAGHSVNLNVSQSDSSARPSVGKMIWQMFSLGLAATTLVAIVVGLLRNYRYRALVMARGHEPTVEELETGGSVFGACKPPHESAA